MEAICSIGMKEDNLSLQELSSSEKRRTVKSNKLKRQMQYRYEREQSEPAGTYRNPAKWRTVKTNKLKRQMQYGHERGAIWARQYLLKASKAKLEVSTATKAKLAGACPDFMLYCIGACSFNFSGPSPCRARLAGACSISYLYCIGAYSFNFSGSSHRRGEVSGNVLRLHAYTAWSRILIIFSDLHLIPLLDSACLLH